MQAPGTGAKGLKLVHGVVFTTGKQCVFTREVFFVIIANVRSGKILVFDRCHIPSDLLALDVSYISQHTEIAKVALR